MTTPFPQPPKLRAAVIIDYQNVHLTARNTFDPDGPVWNSIIEPTQFARTAIAHRNKKLRPGYQAARLVRVSAFRGLPHVDHEPTQHRRCQQMARNWRLAGADVQLRDLKYDYERDYSGKPTLDVNGKRIPLGPPREKGIDVLCALACVRAALDPEIDLVILASRDTDLVPVLDDIYDRGKVDRSVAKIETVAWYNARWREEGTANAGSLRATAPRRIWNTNLDRTAYEASLDRTSYL